jgi:AcrR family transcriptional regulator
VAALVTRTQIVDAAEAIVRSEGFEHLSIRQVSARLSVTPAALYWHVSGKDEIVAELVDRILARIEPPDPAHGTWLQRLVHYYSSVRVLLLQYPGISAAMMTHEPTEATLISCLYPFELLVEGGFDEDTAVSLFRAVSTMTTGHLTMIDASRHQTSADTFTNGGPRLRSLFADRPEYAAFGRAMVGFGDVRSREQYLAGLELLVAGAAAAYGVKVPA